MTQALLVLLRISVIRHTHPDNFWRAKHSRAHTLHLLGFAGESASLQVCFRGEKFSSPIANDSSSQPHCKWLKFWFPQFRSPEKKSVSEILFGKFVKIHSNVAEAGGFFSAGHTTHFPARGKGKKTKSENGGKR